MNNKNGLVTKASEGYLARLKQIVGLQESYDVRATQSRNQIENLEQQLGQLSNRLLEELDAEKINKISSESRNLRYQIDDLKLILNADVDTMIKSKLHEDSLEVISNQASEEYRACSDWYKKEISNIQAEADARIKELENQSKQHPYLIALSVYNQLAHSAKR